MTAFRRTRPLRGYEPYFFNCRRCGAPIMGSDPVKTETMRRAGYCSGTCMCKDAQERKAQNEAPLITKKRRSGRKPRRTAPKIDPARLRRMRELGIAPLED